MERIWLKHYPPDVPQEINPDQYQSLVELFETNCKKYSQQSAFYNLGVSITYQQLDDLSRAFAAYLQKKLHLKKGDRLAIMLPNLLHFPIALFGGLRAGLTIVNVNPLYTVPEFSFQLKDSGAETIIVLENFAHIVEKALPQTAIKNLIVAKIGDFFPWWKALIAQFVLKYVKRKIPAWHLEQAVSFKKVIAWGKRKQLNAISIQNQDIAFLQYTGGTTGVSKGAMLTHRNMLANIEQAFAWFRPKLEPGKEVVITALPLYHIFSLLVNCLLYATKVGGMNVLITNPRDIPGMIAEMAKFKFTCITGVNTLFNFLLKNSRFSTLDFSHLKVTVGGGAPVQHVVAERWQAVTGVVILEGYGLTEASPCVTANPYTIQTFSGNIGLPLPSTDVAILDDEGQPMALGQAGELAVQGPQVMLGYWQKPIETQKVLLKNNWLLTGDIATMNPLGELRILERKKDMILVSGFNVYPTEIEDVIAAIPGVLEVAVVGIPDELSGEAVKACVIRNNDQLTQEQVIQYCRQSLTSYKIPKVIEFYKELPKTTVGKILRRALRSCHENRKC